MIIVRFFAGLIYKKHHFRGKFTVSRGHSNRYSVAYTQNIDYSCTISRSVGCTPFTWYK